MPSAGFIEQKMRAILGYSGLGYSGPQSQAFVGGLYTEPFSHLQRRHLIESQDVEFEEVEDKGRERISPDLDSSDDDPDMGTDTDKHIDLEDSEGGQKSTLNPQGNDLPAPELSTVGTKPAEIHRAPCWKIVYIGIPDDKNLLF